MEFALATRELKVPLDHSLDIKEQVRQAIDIVDLVGGYMQLRRQGRGYVGLCPWHDDSRPSLQVNPERQSFKCWVCDIGGDVFSFIMKMEGVEFREALVMLAERAGVQVPKTPRRPPVAMPGGTTTGEAAEPSPGGYDKRTLYRAAAWAEREYHKCLLTADGAAAARKYLDQRGISAESIEQFHLGFSPLERDWILRQAKGSAGRAKILETIGILARPAGGGEHFDRFRGRLLFSIRDVQGRPVGIGGRVLPELGSTSPSKYVNSPETPLFTKSNLLYGLDLAREAVRRSGTALVMEGYTDVIVAHQFGFQNAVAVLGTALGENHVKILKRFADRIVLVLDGDEAGQKRTNEVLELFVAQQVSLHILTLPEDLDPCDFLQQRGAEAFAALLAEGTVDALEHAVRAVTRGLNIETDINGATQALDRLLAIVARAPQLSRDTTTTLRLREEKFLQRMAARFRVDEALVRARMTELRRRQRQPARANEAAPAATEKPDASERSLLEMLLAHPEHWQSARAEIAADHLTAATCRQIYETGCRLSAAGVTPRFERLMLELDDPAVKNLLVELDELGQAKLSRTAEHEAIWEELLKTFQRKEVQRQRATSVAALGRQQPDDSQQQAAVLEDILRRERNRQGISKPTDG
jgi:DNA primase